MQPELAYGPGIDVVAVFCAVTVFCALEFAAVMHSFHFCITHSRAF